MAETLNYRLNLVIDPKNVIKANRELRAMERYFERIQGRVLKIGRTRMVPEIALKDSASKGLDSLLEKINRVKSQVIRATAHVNVMAQGPKAGGSSSEGASQMIQIIQANSTAVLKLTGIMESINTGTSGEKKKEEPKSIWDTIKDGFGAVKSLGNGTKSVGELPEKFKKLKNPDKKDEAKTAETAGQNSPALPKETEAAVPKPKSGRFRGKGGKFLGKMTAFGDLIGTFGSAGEDLIGGVQGIGKLLGGKKKAIIDAVASGPGKKLLGPLGYAADAFSIATAKPGKERAEAVGSAVGGGIGATVGGAIGSIIPIGGTLIGSTLGGAAGSFIGEKVGGWVSDNKEKIENGFKNMFPGWFSKKVKAPKDFSDKPAVMTAPAPAAAPKSKEPAQSMGVSMQYSAAAWSSQTVVTGAPYPPLSPLPLTSKAYGPYLPGAQGLAAPMGTGPRLQAATGGVKPGIGGNGGGKTTPQLVQISPEQMSALSGFLKDFKTETNYNLPAGAVQVTVHEETPIDVEGLILQIGQRLRSEFAKAAQNRKPGAKAYV
ncbi:hypothetical protein M3647_00380 [Paenibacillus cellulositrophicus]|uniref:hypothetical protein n=1 Tax=Paenibacillus cellulositrophicus TaxID=562959 RepID=UPI0020407CE9|nr:hypothetical protein [Paenibacillus cellulositrophicus]MCM2995924.1 hypothetical protein [Paenibacillus cellulositrophicus]